PAFRGRDPPCCRDSLPPAAQRIRGWPEAGARGAICSVGLRPRGRADPRRIQWKPGVNWGRYSIQRIALRGLVRRGVVRRECRGRGDRKSTRLNSSHVAISYAVFCLKKKKSKDRLI